MPSLLGTYVTTNYNRVVGPDYSMVDGARVYEGPFSNFGTRKLKFYKITADNNGAVNFSKATLAGAGAYTDSGSIFALAILALQQFGEVFFVGTPGTAGFIVALADDTANSTDSGNDQGTGFGLMEAAVKAAVGCSGNVAVDKITVQATGVSIA